jgi:hypothetical protein
LWDNFIAANAESCILLHLPQNLHVHELLQHGGATSTSKEQNAQTRVQQPQKITKVYKDVAKVMSFKA